MAHTGVIIDGCNPSRWDEPHVYEHLQRGGVTATNATIAIWEGFQETVDETARWHRRFREHADTLVHVRTAADIERARHEAKPGIILGWQNISPIEDDLERLEAFHALGVRIVQLAYNVRNLVANGCFERHDDGLSHFGVRAVAKLNELGMLIDLSHVGDRSCAETIDLSEQPVAFTHANLREFFDSPRNKPASLVRALAARGGVIGANAFPEFLPRGFDAELTDYLDAIERLVEVAGIDHVGIASDFCEGRDREFWRYLGRLHGTTPHFEIDPPSDNPVIGGLEGAFALPRVADGLRDRGYDDAAVEQIMGGNWLRLYRTVWG